MSPSSGKKIVRKVFYTTGLAAAQADKLKDGLRDIAKSFQAGYHLLGNDPLPAHKGNGSMQTKCDGQLESLYGYFGKIVAGMIGSTQ